MYVWIFVRVDIIAEEGLVDQHQPVEQNRVIDLHHAAPVILEAAVSQCHDNTASAEKIENSALYSMVENLNYITSRCTCWLHYLKYYVRPKAGFMP